MGIKITIPPNVVAVLMPGQSFHQPNRRNDFFNGVGNQATSKKTCRPQPAQYPPKIVNEDYVLSFDGLEWGNPVEEDDDNDGDDEDWDDE